MIRICTTNRINTYCAIILKAIFIPLTFMANLFTTTKFESLIIPVFWMELHIKKRQTKGSATRCSNFSYWHIPGRGQTCIIGAFVDFFLYAQGIAKSMEPAIQWSSFNYTYRKDLQISEKSPAPLGAIKKMQRNKKKALQV